MDQATGEFGKINGDASIERESLIAKPDTIGSTDEKVFPIAITAVAISQDGTMAAAASMRGSIQLWNLEKQEAIERKLVGVTTFASDIEFSPNANPSGTRGS